MSAKPVMELAVRAMRSKRYGWERMWVGYGRDDARLVYRLCRSPRGSGCVSVSHWFSSAELGSTVSPRLMIARCLRKARRQLAAACEVSR